MSGDLLTSRARVLLSIARDPTISHDEIAERARVSRRQVPLIVRDLVAAGYLAKHRPNRRNHYTINSSASLVDESFDATVGELLAVFMHH